MATAPKRNRDPNFPKMVYRAEGHEVKTLIVTSAESLELARAEGWGEMSAAKAVAAKAPRPAPAPAAKGDAALIKENLALVNDLNTAKGALSQKDEMIAAKDGVIASQGDRIIALQNFIDAIRTDENCPDGLRVAIGELLDGEGAAETKPAKGKKK